MARTAEEWSDLYYEQQANHTEARGMLCQERDAALALVQRLEDALLHSHEAGHGYSPRSCERCRNMDAMVGAIVAKRTEATEAPK